MTYRQTVVTERKKGPWDDCTLCAAAMLAGQMTGGEHVPTCAAMRTASRVPDRPNASDGTTIDDAERALRALLPSVAAHVSVGNALWRDFMTELDRSAGAVLAGIASTLPTHYRRWDAPFAGAHAVAVLPARSGYLWWLDPLAPEGYEGELISEAIARRYAEAFSMNVYHMTGDLLVSAGEGEHMITAGGLALSSSHDVALPAGTRVYDSTTSAAASYALTKAITVDYMGLADGKAAVVIRTGNFYPDKVARPSIVYVDRSVGKPTPKTNGN